METILGLVAWSFTWWVVVPLVIFVLWLEYDNSTKSSITFQFILMYILYNILELDLAWTTIALAAGAYVPIGLGWSAFRWSRYVNYVVDKFEENSSHLTPTEISRSKQRSIDNIQMVNQVPMITAWVFSWPLGFVAYFIRDVIVTVELMIKKYFKGVYNRITAKAQARLDKI